MRATAAGRLSVSITKTSSSITSTLRRKLPAASARFTAHGPRRKTFDRCAQIVRAVQQHRVRFSKTLPNVLRHPRPEQLFNLPAFKPLP
jgi:hypothetical protein